MATDSTDPRFARLEQAQRKTAERLSKMEETLARVADVLELHERHFERMEKAILGISERVDRQKVAVTKG